VRRIALAAAIATFTAPLFSVARTGLAKEFEMEGTIDCGLAAGQDCPVADSMTLYTVSISGKNEPFVFDMSWIRPQLEQAGHKQDDLLCLIVEEVPGVGYRGLAVRENCQEIPTENEEDEKRERKNGEPN